MTGIVGHSLKVFKSASSFKRAAALLKQAHKDGDWDMLFPFATNSAHAAELFMKCLMHLDGVSVPKTHSLKELFRNLQKTHREWIRIHFEEEVKKKPYISKVEAFEPEFKFELDKVLEATDNSFEEWRYIFEERDETVRFFAMEELTDALHCYVLTIKTEWGRSV
jgi:HEPN domain-containing protein